MTIAVEGLHKDALLCIDETCHRRMIAHPGDDKCPGRIHRDRSILLVEVGECIDKNLTAICSAIGLVSLRHDICAAVNTDGLPDDHETSISGHRHRRSGLIAGRRRVDLEDRTHRCSVGRITPGVDAIAISVFGFTVPGNHKFARLCPRNCGKPLISGREAVDSKAATNRRPVPVQHLSENSEAAAIFSIADPRHHGLSIGIHCGSRRHLFKTHIVDQHQFRANRECRLRVWNQISMTRDGRMMVCVVSEPRHEGLTGLIDSNARARLRSGNSFIDSKLPNNGRATGIVFVAVDAPTVSILMLALPGNQEIAIAVHRNCWRALRTGCRRIDEGICSQQRSRIIHPPTEDIRAAALLAFRLPHNDSIATAVHCNIGKRLILCRVRVHLKFRARRRIQPTEASSKDLHTGFAFDERSWSLPDNHKLTIDCSNRHAGCLLISGCGFVGSQLGPACSTNRIQPHVVHALACAILAGALPCHRCAACGVHCDVRF